MSVGTLEEQSAGRKKLVMSVIHFDSNKHWIQFMDGFFSLDLVQNPISFRKFFAYSLLSESFESGYKIKPSFCVFIYIYTYIYCECKVPEGS